MARATILPPKIPPRLKDEEWERIWKYLERRLPKVGRPAANLRQSLEGMRWVGANGKPWCDMPAEFGDWSTVKRYYARLEKRCLITGLLKAFPTNPAKGPDYHERRTVGVQLACLRQVTERRPRGAAAKTPTPSTEPIGLQLETN